MSLHHQSHLGNHFGWKLLCSTFLTPKERFRNLKPNGRWGQLDIWVWESKPSELVEQVAMIEASDNYRLVQHKNRFKCCKASKWWALIQYLHLCNVNNGINLCIIDQRFTRTNLFIVKWTHTHPKKRLSGGGKVVQRKPDLPDHYCYVPVVPLILQLLLATIMMQTV